jgi:hypothetical protein
MVSPSGSLSLANAPLAAGTVRVWPWCTCIAVVDGIGSVIDRVTVRLTLAMPLSSVPSKAR